MGPKLLTTLYLVFTLGVLPLNRTAPPDATHINNALDECYRKYPRENIALLTDREVYNPGETIWFSGYLTCLGKPSTVSKLAYVELIDSNGLIVHRSILPVEDGATEGNLAIPGDFPDGWYQLRAYTGWMLNFDPALFFRKRIWIGDMPPPTIFAPTQRAVAAHADSTASVQNAASPAGYTFDWFPEGGNLVEGLTSKLAFLVRTSDGQPVDVTGKLIDSSGKAIRPFSTLHDGMGSFVIHPSTGNTYAAIIDFPGGITKKIALPTPGRSGVVLYINHFLAANGDDSIYFRLSRSIAEKEKYQHLVLCAEMQGKVDFTYINFDSDFAGNYNNSVLTAPTALSIDSFPGGVLHLTVFDDKEQPLVQRLVYLQRSRSKALPILSWDVRSVEPHARNSFRLEIPGDSAGIYTVSITHQPANDQPANGPSASSTPAPLANPSALAAPDILSTLLLSADIRDEITDPGWYRNTQPATLRALDLLMLTSTWNRFDWSKILHSQYPPIRYNAEQFLSLKGQAFWGSGKNKKPIRNGEFSLMVKAAGDSLFDMMNVPVDSAGRFTLVNLSFHDTASFYVQNKNQKKDREVTVLFDRNPLDTIRTAPPLYRTESSSAAAGSSGAANSTGLRALNNHIHTGLPEWPGQHKQKDTTILKTALVQGHRKTRTDSLLENYATGIFANPSAWAKTIDLTDDRWTENRYDINVVDWLVGKVAGLQFSSTMSGGTRIPLVAWRFTNGLFVSANQTQLYERNAPDFYLDEEMLNDGSGNYEIAMELLTAIPIAQVSMIRIFQPGTFAGASGMAPHGVIAIYTKNGSEGKFRYIPSTFNKMKKLGYAPLRSFSAPDYDHPPKSADANPASPAIPRPDNRPTLYWNPALIPDAATHTATFSFFNDDTPGPFRITIQGLDRNGRLLLIDTVFKQ